MATPLNLSGLTDVANSQAKNMYYMALANGSDANTALQRAMFEWQKTMDTAQMTGKWNGQWSNPQEQWFTGQFGQWFGEGGAPTPGQQTLEAEGQRFNQALGLSGMYGQYYAPGTAPTQGQQTFEAQQAALNQANNLAQLYGQAYTPGQQAAAGTQTLAAQAQQFGQGLQTQQEQRAAQAQLQGQTMGYLNLLSNLRGPADWAKYQQVLGATPGGMRDLYAAAMGQYVPGAGATTGVQPQAASLQSMMGQIAGQPYYGQGGGQLGQPSVYQGGQGAYGAPQQNELAGYGRIGNGYGQATGGGDYASMQTQAAPQQNEQAWAQTPNNQTWGSGIGVGQQQPTSDQQMQGYGGGTNLPAPNQMSAQSWNNLQPSQQQMLLGSWEAQGYDKNDAMNLYKQSLPRYGSSNQATAGTWRM